MKQVRLRSRRRARHSLLRLCLASALVFCLGWSALWLFARREASNAIDGLIAREAEHGRQWTCPDRKIGGFPLELRVSCAAPSFRGTIGGETVDVSLAGIEARARLYQRNSVEASLISPAKILAAGQDVPAVLAWSSLTVTGRGPADGPGRVEVQLEHPSLDSRGTTSTALHAELHVEPASGSPIQEHVYALRFRLDQGSVPALDAVAKTIDPLSVQVTALLTQAVAATSEPWQVLVERWRQAGGTCQIQSMNLEKGELNAEAGGALGLDDEHRLSGQLDATVSTALVSRLLDKDVTGGSIPFGLSMLLKAGLSQTRPDRVPFPVSFANGRVLVARFPTAQRLAPFY